MFNSPNAVRLVRPLAAAAAAAFAMGAVAAHATVVMLPSTADIFLAGQAAPPATNSLLPYFPQQTAGGNFGNGAGTLPDAIMLTPFEIAHGIIVSATGTISCGVSCVMNGPDGSTQYTHGASTTTNGPFTVMSYTGTTSAVLVGAWGGSDPSTTAFFVGSGPIFFTPPAGDDILYLGFVDSFGGSPYAGTYNDDTGHLSVSVTGVPELASWALMGLGFIGLGFAGYRRTRGFALV